MSIQNKIKGSLEPRLHGRRAELKSINKNIDLHSLCNIQNGSITFLKQDNIIIQININEKIIFN